MVMEELTVCDSLIWIWNMQECRMLIGLITDNEFVQLMMQK